MSTTTKPPTVPRERVHVPGIPRSRRGRIEVARRALSLMQLKLDLATDDVLDTPTDSPFYARKAARFETLLLARDAAQSYLDDYLAYLAQGE